MTPVINLPPGQSPITPAEPVGVEAMDKQERKKSWFGKSKKDKDAPQGPFAWIAGHPQRQPFDHVGLRQGRPVPELWDEEEGNCYIHLFPQTSGKGPSFKIDSGIFSSSATLRRMAFGDSYSNHPAANGDRANWPLNDRMQDLSVQDPRSPPDTPHRHGGAASSRSSRDSRGGYSNFSDTPAEAHLFMPLKLKTEGATPVKGSHGEDAVRDDLQTLIDFRNFFAFLCGQSIIATERRGSFFHIFMTIASLLKAYEFSNLDGSTFGEGASSSFDAYVDELGLADVRASREKTIEGVVLGERMKSVLLYNEAFTHAVGKLEDLTSMKSQKFGLISGVTQNRLARASMDLDKRTASVRLILNDFEFPSLFSGIMVSKMAEERKEGVRFDAWKDAFLGMRKWFMSTLKQRYGDWPPKAKSKKNDLETSGLQRVVLRDLYRDLSEVYDLMVDRNQLTTRTVDGVDLEGEREEPTIRALRSVLSEYDRSSPPVKPPIPFDLPLLPNLKTTRPDFNTGDKKKDLKALSKKLKDDEIRQLHRSSWNGDARLTPFVKAFQDLESRAAHGCTIGEIVDLRIGQWIFLYVVFQALPMLACDAPRLKYTQGVEYFLCEPPRSGVPWADPEKAAAGKRSWYAVGDAGGVVSLPSDVVEHGVEGIYRRSHCWQMAEVWTASNPIMNTALHEQEASNAQGLAGVNANGRKDSMPASLRAPSPAPGLLPPGSRSASPAASRNSKRLSSLNVGLEALPLPAGVTPDGSVPTGAEAPRAQHQVDSAKTFDAILGDVNKGKKKKR